ncbi:MAG: choloylglycine hydrolase family protein [Verrucomicrobia bacterium]|nr:choloylglycine hydrolase family protein [Verrucomicrobiota bacterium]MBU6445969.1 choloylglycine hydrolase family protein [Verrucomicrobiota bacterium]MDE3047654.1 choloylglycine hydrolase family protein [Verrucomicrobiota bacterium]
MKIFFLLFFAAAFACTDFVVQAKDGALINGRSLEFGKDLQSIIRLFPRGQKTISQAPGQTPGLGWISKYGYLGVTCLGLSLSFDGINETGLSFGYLWLPGVTEYPTVQDSKKALDFTDFCAWVLGNFATVAEVKEALQNVSIWGHAVPSLGIPPVHAAIHDAKGNHLVVEFVQGKMQVYDNPISILTNSPPFDWQITNLQNTLNFSPYNPNSVAFRGVSLSPPGQGGGLWGLPGDFSPPSRFVKIATLLRLALQPNHHSDAVNLAEHLLNSVDIPLGTVRDPGQDTGDFTQWVIIKDLTNRALYFRSYGDLTLKKIDLKKLNFTKENKNSLPLDLRRGFVDVTDSLSIKNRQID